MRTPTKVDDREDVVVAAASAGALVPRVDQLAVQRCARGRVRSPVRRTESSVSGRHYQMKATGPPRHVPSHSLEGISPPSTDQTSTAVRQAEVQVDIADLPLAAHGAACCVEECMVMVVQGIGLTGRGKAAHKSHGLPGRDVGRGHILGQSGSSCF